MQKVTQIPWIDIPGAGTACPPLQRGTEGKDPAQAQPRRARPATSEREFVMWGQQQEPKWMEKQSFLLLSSFPRTAGASSLLQGSAASSHSSLGKS